MKLHTLALCLVGAVSIGLPASADDHHRSNKGRDRDRAMSQSYFTEERMYFIGNLYPELPPLREVADKVTQLVSKQQMEVAHLTAMQPSAQTAGYSNIVTVYDAMITDHNAIADFGAQWLSKYGFPVPARPTSAAVADMAPAAGVDHMIDMHQKAFDESIAMRQGERSSTVRGMLLWAAAGTARHLSWLRALDRDVEFGRKTVSARLNSVMRTDVVHDQLVERIMIEDREIFGVTTQPQVLEQVVEVPVTVEKIVEVERIVEKPVERVVERVVEKPVYVDRVVEKVVYRDRPVRSNVAGRRGTFRRPAK